jgi:hypothetical protein
MYIHVKAKADAEAKAAADADGVQGSELLLGVWSASQATDATTLGHRSKWCP